MPATKQKETAEAATTNFAKSQLKALVERIERLEEEKKAQKYSNGKTKRSELNT
jgi:uncharacterized protein (UPF0335 family)